jgi:hypothetical protein
LQTQVEFLDKLEKKVASIPAPSPTCGFRMVFRKEICIEMAQLLFPGDKPGQGHMTQPKKVPENH